MRRGERRFSILVLGTIVIGLLAPTAWYAAHEPSAAAPGPPIPGNNPTLTVASINTAMVTEVETMAKELERHTLLRNADVIFLQEAVRRSDDELSSGELLARRLGRHTAFAAADSTTFSGLAILSRLPLRDVQVRQLKNVKLVFRSRKRIALAATIDTPHGEVRIINTHLDTRINPRDRLEQLGPALADAEAFSGAAVIGGDLNTNDMQWVSHVVPLPNPGWQASEVRRLMLGKGFSTPFQLRRATFDHLRMQLDWLFSKRLPPLRSAIQPLDFSDHHAIWAEFQIPRIQ